MSFGPHLGPVPLLASVVRIDAGGRGMLKQLIRGGNSEKNSQFHTLWETENFVLNKTKGGELLVRVYCETGDTRTAKLNHFSGLFPGGAPN